MTLGMTSPEAIEQAFTALVGDVVGVEYAEDHEPERIQKRPAVTMVYLRYLVRPEEEQDIGPQIEVCWQWRIHLYVDLANGKWKEAQTTYRDLASRLVTLPKLDRNLSDTCEQWQLDDLGHEPDFGEHREGMLLKEFQLSAWTYELPA